MAAAARDDKLKLRQVETQSAVQVETQSAGEHDRSGAAHPLDGARSAARRQLPGARSG